MAGRPHNRLTIVVNVSEVQGGAHHHHWFGSHTILFGKLWPHSQCHVVHALWNAHDIFQCWWCSSCKCRKSVLSDSFFSGAKVPVKVLVDLIYWWSLGEMQTVVAKETGLSHSTLVDWCNVFREICCQSSIDHPVQRRSEHSGRDRWVQVFRAKVPSGASWTRTLGTGNGAAWQPKLLHGLSVPDMRRPLSYRLFGSMFCVARELQRTCSRPTTSCKTMMHLTTGFTFVDPNDRTIHTNTVGKLEGKVSLLSRNVWCPSWVTHTRVTVPQFTQR